MAPQPSHADSSSKPTPPERPNLAPGLYVVATPIGNAGDITLRALEVLKAADVIACEDTRTTGSLMARLGIRTPRLPYHEHNAARQRPALLSRLAEGQAVALVSDAGTPLVNDPGYKLTTAAIEAGHAVIPIPGASAPLAALVASGLPSDRFLYAGFPPPKDAARRTFIAELAPIPATLILFESARRLPDTLVALADVLGDRPAAVCRELTKLYEEIRRESLTALAQHYAEMGPPKGEVVIVVGPPNPEAIGPDRSPGALDARLRAAFAEGLGTKDAAAQVAADTGVARRDLYQRALTLSQEDNA
ncbi:16S rRNA (cytidine(1402)-2'-O)-methyltransferase [Roseospira marina]|uniref:Ribosomal RNA small subunit methyltransferase I n=1 Tax=Roseospira marina TaxID=140057 RepID=A0A5M6IC65_9PROT|nr:16S rRNA (cytidine(1402)-2'-O)-methyltransferase [Roseospira marina]KAA5605793.1 16S rRNA (cytidine(1402)-2'-O)-methyltransferase [Roseospira marina]MBB4313606.1 16S rRNA (cytidine1402-2'-O)-methyltransferase [Roseospira marina]MBB5086768.1 16S rRNA (cytidine1402-2'-O)-methyltransferase [Roseospira marina]